MKTRINSIHDALSYLLQGLSATETALSKDFNTCCQPVMSSHVASEIENYVRSSENKLLKLERAFSYLMKEPMTRVNNVITGLIDGTRTMLAMTTSDHLKNILTVNCLQDINAYKISGYRSAYLFAIELELDTVSDLLQQILEWEVETSNTLSALSVAELNKDHQQL